MIYLLSCKESNVQYVRKITFPLQKGINLHRRAKSEYKYVIKHSKDVCVGAYFSVQITELFPCTGCNNNKMCSVNRESRLDREYY